MTRNQKFVAHAFIDWDDTLRLNQILYDDIREENAAILLEIFAGRGETRETIKALVHRFDLALTAEYGLAAHRYPSAWTTAYEHLCRKYGIEYSRSVAESLRRVAFSVYTRPQPPVPGAHNLLSWLRSINCEINIWTAGDPDIQLKKIERSGWRRLIDNIRAVPEKTAGALKDYIGKRPTDRCFVVGNSPASDIEPALQLGILAVHIPRDTWEYDEAEIDPGDPNYVRVPDLWHVPTVLQERLGLSDHAIQAGI